MRASLQHHSELYSVSNVVCIHVGLPRVHSRGSGGLDFGLDVGVQLSCTADWKVFGLGPGTASVALLSSVQLDLRMQRNATTELPDGVRLVDQREG